MDDPIPNDPETSPSSDVPPSIPNGDDRRSLPLAAFDPQEGLLDSPPSQPDNAFSVDGRDPSLPEFVNGQFYSLDPRNITVDVIVQMTSAAVLSVGGLVGLVFLWTNLGFSALFFSLLGLSLFVMGCLFLAAYFWPPIDYRNTSFRIDPLGIEIRQGVWWRHQTCVPIGRVQHADVSQGPIQRMNGVASLTLHTAGTSNASVAIDGLAHQFAIDIRDWIVHQRKNEDAV